MNSGVIDRIKSYLSYLPYIDIVPINSHRTCPLLLFLNIDLRVRFAISRSLNLVAENF